MLGAELGRDCAHDLWQVGKKEERRTRLPFKVKDARNHVQRGLCCMPRLALDIVCSALIHEVCVMCLISTSLCMPRQSFRKNYAICNSAFVGPMRSAGYLDL